MGNVIGRREPHGEISLAGGEFHIFAAAAPCGSGAAALVSVSAVVRVSKARDNPIACESKSMVCKTSAAEPNTASRSALKPLNLFMSTIRGAVDRDEVSSYSAALGDLYAGGRR